MARKSAIEKAMEAVMAQLAQGGVDTSAMSKTVDTNYRNDDAVALSSHIITEFVPRVCRNCNKPFAVTSKIVGYCSTPCRVEDWEKRMGVPWGAISSNDPWHGDPPIIIKPEQFHNLEVLTDWFTQAKMQLLAEMKTEEQEQEVFSVEVQQPEQVEEYIDLENDPHTIPQFSLAPEEPVQTLPAIEPFRLP